MSVIDPAIAHDDRGTADKGDDRWVMVIKNEMSETDGGKNLCLLFSDRMQGPYDVEPGPPIVLGRARPSSIRWAKDPPYSSTTTSVASTGTPRSENSHIVSPPVRISNTGSTGRPKCSCP